MCHKRVLSLIALVSVISTSFFSPGVKALAGQDQTQTPLVIKQIRKEQAAALISRPDPLDERIRDIINANNIVSVADYARWLGAHLCYQRDEGKDYWSLPEDTLARGCGDCEDLAFLNKAVLGVLGYEPRVLCVLRAFRSHAICVFEDNGYYHIVDNTRLKRIPARSFDELLQYLFIVYNCASIGEVDLSTQDYQVLARRRDFASK